MLPDYPDEKRKVWNHIRTLTKAIIEHESPLMAKVRHVRYHEGDSSRLHREDGKVVEGQLKRMEAAATVSKTDLDSFGFDLTLQTIESMAKQMAEKQTRMLLDHVEEVTREIGNTVDGKGRAFDTDMIFEAYEKLEVSFHDDGTPNLPSLIMNPSTIPAAKAAFAKIDADPDLTARWKDMIEKKREKWNDRQNTRKLVD